MTVPTALHIRTMNPQYSSSLPEIVALKREKEDFSISSFQMVLIHQIPST